MASAPTEENRQPASTARRRRVWLPAVGLGMAATTIGVLFVVATRVLEVRRAALDRDVILAALADAEPEACLTIQAEEPAGPVRGRVDVSDVVAAAAGLEQRWRRAPSPDTLRDAVAARLALGHAETAVAMILESPVADRSAVLWNDLAVSYVAAARRGSAVERYVRALDAAYRAAAMRPDRREAWLNLAIISNRLKLSSLGRDALARSGESPCPGRFDDVRGAGLEFARSFESSHRAAAVASMTEAPRFEADGIAREVLERELLRAWAKAVVAGDEVAAGVAMRRAVEVVGTLAVTDDAQSRALIQLLGGGVAARDGRRARAWLAYLDVVEGTEQEEFGRSREALQRLKASVTEADSPLWELTMLEDAAALRLGGRGAHARLVLEALIERSGRRRYLRIAGRAHWSLGLLLEEGGAIGQSFAHYSEAESLLLASGDREGVAVVRVRLGRLFHQLNEPSRGWDLIGKAMDDLPMIRRFRRDAVLRAAAILASSHGLHGAALAFQEGPFIEALSEESAGGLAFLYPDRARALKALGLSDLASRAVSDGHQWLARMSDVDTRRMAEAVQLRAEALVADQRDPERSLEALTRALSIYRERDDAFAIPELQLARARVLRRLGRPEHAVAALTEGAALVEKRRDSLVNEAERVRVTALGWDLYRELADLQYQQAGVNSALAVLDRGRNWLVNDERTIATAEVAPGTLVVSYALLPSGAFGVAQSAEGRRSFVITWPSERLQASIAGFRQSLLEGDSRSSTALGGELSAVLLGPVVAELRRLRTLVVVPDDALASVPFATLPSPIGPGPIVATHVVLIRPSVRSREAATRPEPALSALVLGDPDSSAIEGLRRLPGARDEARSVASAYERAILRLGADATPDVLSRFATAAEVVHFAGHALADAADPSLSRLVLARSSAAGTGLVFDRDLARLDLRATRVVVLAACDTARPGQAAGPAVFGLARTLLDAGASAVVATVWPVPDRVSIPLFVALHRYLRQGRPIGEALRSAQLEMIANGVEPHGWGGVLAIGDNVSLRQPIR